MSETIHAFGENGELSRGAAAALEDFLTTQVNPAISEVMSDSGLRDITQEWADVLTPDNTGYIYLRRIGPMVHLHIHNLRIEATPGVTFTKALVPSGFRPLTDIFGLIPSYWSSDAATDDYRFMRGGSVSLQGRNATTSTHLTATWLTDQPWPTTLPGTPA